MSVSITLPSSISPDTACEALTTVPTSSCSTGASIVAARRRRSRFLAQFRVALVELPHLAEAAPAQIATARGFAMGVRAAVVDPRAA